MKNTRISSVVMGAALTASVLVMPFAAFAKEDGKGHNDQKPKIEHVEKKSPGRSEGSHKVENKKIEDRNQCFRAFGHFIAKGWKKNQGQNEGNFICNADNFPFGIRWNFWGNPPGHATSTVSTTTAPVLSNVSISSITQTSAMIKWNTDKYSTSKVWVSSTSPINVSGEPSFKQNSMVKNHMVTVNGLNANTVYYAVVSSVDAFGNTATSTQIPFTTSAVPVVLPVITNLLSSISSTTANINWNTNVNSDSKVYYSTSSPVTIGALGTYLAGTSTMSTNHSVSLTGLATSTTYYFLAQSTDALNNTKVSNQLSITTLAN